MPFCKASRTPRAKASFSRRHSASANLGGSEMHHDVLLVRPYSRIWLTRGAAITLKAVRVLVDSGHRFVGAAERPTSSMIVGSLTPLPLWRRTVPCARPNFPQRLSIASPP